MTNISKPSDSSHSSNPIASGTHTFDFKRENLLPYTSAHFPTEIPADTLTPPATAELTRLVNFALNVGPLSVVRDKRLAPSQDPHDYTSIAPYFWPNPATPDGLPGAARR